MQATPVEGYRAWAPHYDETPNPLLALESRVLSALSAGLAGRRVLDAGCGTGRWMARLVAAGAHVIGVDLSDTMLSVAAGKSAVRGKCVLADISHLPMANDSFDLALCSFTLSYAPRLYEALAELARAARSIIVTDLHPEAMRRGWKRSFRGQDRTVEISHRRHTLDELDEAALKLGLVRHWRFEAHFGEQERDIFRMAGKDSAFAEMSGCPALLVTSWAK